MITFKDYVFLFIEEHEQEMVKASIGESKARKTKNRDFLKSCKGLLREIGLSVYVCVTPSTEYKLQLNNTKQYKMQYADNPENLDLIKILAEENGVSQAHYLRTLIHAYLKVFGFKAIETRYKKRESPAYAHIDLNELIEEEVFKLSSPVLNMFKSLDSVEEDGKD